MHFENPDDQSMLFAAEEPSCMYSVKEELLEKATNHNPCEHKPNYFPHAFENSPHRGSFFFTPNSPRPLRFELSIDSHPLHRTVPQRPAINKKLNLEEEFEEVQEKESPSPEAVLQMESVGKVGRNSKGLKYLSESVYNIVSQLSTTKYKEVADRLVSEIISEEEGTGDKRKDEHNVKRRVYDALNVLIAAGLLRKEGKDVLCNEPLSWEEPAIDPSQIREKQRLEGQLHARMASLAEKQQKLLKLQKKRSLIEYIINRNRMQPEKEELLLRFPLIAALVSNPNSSSHKVAANNTLLLRVGEKVKLYGDVDLLLQINKDNMEMDNLLNNICCEEKQELKMEQEYEK